jgi:hypothetical protein
VVQVQVDAKAMTFIDTIFILTIWPYYWEIGCSGITTSLVTGTILMIWPYW